MTDRELLELAAKAAGIEVTPHSNNRISPKYVFLAHGQNWNPLIDDGDALRLAVKLGICLWHYVNNQQIGVEDQDGSKKCEWYEGDAYAATRRAIVRAAAEIGWEK